MCWLKWPIEAKVSVKTRVYCSAKEEGVEDVGEEEKEQVGKEEDKGYISSSIVAFHKIVHQETEAK